MHLDNLLKWKLLTQQFVNQTIMTVFFVSILENYFKKCIVSGMFLRR